MNLSRELLQDERNLFTKVEENLRLKEFDTNFYTLRM